MNENHHEIVNLLLLLSTKFTCYHLLLYVLQLHNQLHHDTYMYVEMLTYTGVEHVYNDIVRMGLVLQLPVKTRRIFMNDNVLY